MKVVSLVKINWVLMEMIANDTFAARKKYFFDLFAAFQVSGLQAFFLQRGALLAYIIVCAFQLPARLTSFSHLTCVIGGSAVIGSSIHELVNHALFA